MPKADEHIINFQCQYHLLEVTIRVCSSLFVQQ